MSQVIIIGAGFAGICMGIRLRAKGLHDFRILERADEVGGTWRDNVYPGCECDVPSSLYGFSFEKNPDWSQSFAAQQEIQDYLQHCVKKYDLAAHISCGSGVAEARFDAREALWRLSLVSGEEYLCQHLVSAVGLLVNPRIPEIPGMGSFAGKAFHSAHWQADCDLEDKKVAVIGTGASAIQTVPSILDSVASIDVFQRSAAWVLPKFNIRIGRWRRWLYRRLPPLQGMARNAIYWFYELRVLVLSFFPSSGRFLGAIASWHLRRQLASAEVAQQLTPDYQIGCKRVLLSNDYYPAFNDKKVSLIGAGIFSFDAKGINTDDGAHYDCDVVIFCTGFETASFLAPLKVYGSGGESLESSWSERTEAFLGVHVNGFPNLHMLLGPNTGLAHTSVVFMIEAQVHYIIQAIRSVNHQGKKALDVKPGVQRQFNHALQEKLAHTVWASGCNSWYLDEGQNHTLWPGFTFDYWLRTRLLDCGNYQYL